MAAEYVDQNCLCSRTYLPEIKGREDTSEEKTTLLLVEDDPRIRTCTERILHRYGYHVATVGTAKEAILALRDKIPGVVLLDICLPDIDGLTLTAKLRGEGLTVPILILTARDLASDIVRGLEAGADDYVSKPFDGSVLAARVAALLRRPGRTSQKSLQFAGLEIDLASRKVTCKGEEIHLSATEYKLLELFAQKPGQLLTRKQILSKVWGDSNWGDTRVVTVNIQRLRSKLPVEVVQTIRGEGYRVTT